MAEPARNISKVQPLNAREADRAPAQKSVAREYGEAMIIALVLAVFIRTFFVQAYKIPSGSMEPTLLIGDHILVNKIIFGLRMPDSIFGLEIPGLPLGQYVFHLEPVHRGDVVVFVFPARSHQGFHQARHRRRRRHRRGEERRRVAQRLADGRPARALRGRATRIDLRSRRATTSAP